MPKINDPAIDYKLVGKTLMHETQQEILERLLEIGESLSPNEFTRYSGKRLGSVSYHFTALRDRGWIKLSGTKPRRGALEHYYAIDPVVLVSGQ